ncbi:MAG: transcriptional regulator [Bacillus thermozeamaize]|uniref:Transcriptional regulator n=1 Tax=Bacillus thermozeamaize TaxID=230954 RepID=A0A1Y3PL50_9BACI|nr:MAG: transcriptional regulator [Bacillus thermozeamaize]
MERIEDCINFLLGKAYQKANQLSKQKLSSYNLTSVQFAVLHLLWEKDGRHAAELGERLLLDGATMTGLLDRLIQKGLIVRRPDPNDRRVNRIYLTNKGKRLEQKLNQKMDEANEELLKHFTEAEVASLKRMLAKIGGVNK